MPTSKHTDTPAKKPYEPPTLEKREVLIQITESAPPPAVPLPVISE